jgi:uncharacterized membrane protein YoaK (UPF0700 family)
MFRSAGGRSEPVVRWAARVPGVRARRGGDAARLAPVQAEWTRSGALRCCSAITLAIGVFAVAAMAIQNVASRTIFAAHAPSTVMTGNVTQTVMDAVDVALGADAAPARARLRKLLPSVGGFAIGAIAGGLGFVRVGFWCLIVPLLAILCVAWLHRRARQADRAGAR